MKQKTKKQQNTKNQVVLATSVASRTPVKVDKQRDELNMLLPLYILIRDAILGEPAIKGMVNVDDGISVSPNVSAVAGAFNGLGDNLFNTARAQRYLPMPNPSDTSNENQLRYKAYLARAVYYEVTGRTLEAMCGQIFLRDPVFAIPDQLKLMQQNADGAGLSLDATAYRACRITLSYGRSGILVDYPVTGGKVTKKQAANGDIQPTLTIYHPWDIINWRTQKRGSKTVLSMVVLREFEEDVSDDGFDMNMRTNYRVLSLDDDGSHKVEIYKKDGANYGSDGPIYPTDAKGKPLTDIPFQFIGSENNDIAPNRPPMYGLASMNIAHYRNSADYEEACYIAGQPTLVVAGLTQDWVENVFKNETIELGSRAAISLPVGGTANIVQAQENSMPQEAMTHKEAQMVALGAKLVQVQKTARSATQQIIETTSESSTLSNVAQNVSEAIVWALKIAAQFVGGAIDTIKYELNNDFDLTSMTADDQNAIIKQWQSGAILFKEMRKSLKRAGTATDTRDDAVVFQEILDEQKQKLDAGLVTDLNPDVPAPVPGGPSANPAVPTKKAPSKAGGPQPGPARRQSKP